MADPRWNDIRDYAKLVYEEVTGDDLKAWEKSKATQVKPPHISRKPIDFEEYTAFKEKTYPHYLLQCEQKAIGDKSLFCFVVDLLFAVWEMSSKEFQERFWVRKKHPIYDSKSCSKTRADFSHCASILIGQKRYITKEQSDCLQKLSDMIGDFEKDPSVPVDPGYGINDAEIIKHPKWQNIREYAKQVYTEITGDQI